jgi:hypothetical protein
MKAMRYSLYDSRDVSADIVRIAVSAHALVALRMGPTGTLALIFLGTAAGLVGRR